MQSIIQSKITRHFRLTRLVLRAAAFLLLTTGCTFAYTQLVNAASLSGWTAGRIIDDVVMTNDTTMTAGQIQTFLNSKVPTCDTSGSQNSEMNNSGVPDYNGNGSIQRWEWGKYHYNQTTFPCLKDYKQNNVSAAQIIYNAAQTYSINPQVLIVLLQKEQGLVTDTWPLNIQYRSATGYGCPDGAACDSQYYGLTNQLNWAAKMFRAIQNNSPTWYTPYVLGNNYIQYNPIGSCGGTTVNIQNRATQALYNYTPYQPNRAALNAGSGGYGSGDSCSSYGNRNFFLYFTDWFGSTYAPSYSSQYVSQSSNPTLTPGESATVYLTLRNTGNQTWYDDTTASAAGKKPMHLATSKNINRASAFADSSWGSGKNRPAMQFAAVYDISGTQYSSNPHVVKQGESAKFQFTITVPNSYPPNTYREYFQLVQEGGVGPIAISIIPWISVTVQKLVTAQYSNQASYPSIRGGETASNFITFKNTGNTNWYDNVTAGSHNAKPVRLATFNPLNRASDFADISWGAGANRPTGVFTTVYSKNGTAYSTNPHVVKPGESAKFQFTLTAPDNYTPGTYKEYFGLVEDSGIGVIPTNVTPWINVTTLDAPAARPLSSTTAEKITQTTNTTHTYSFKNTGTTTWSSTSTVLKLTNGSSDGLRGNSWTSSTVAAPLNESSVAPGATGTFTVTYEATAPPQKRTLTYSPYINGVSAGVSNMTVTETIEAPDYHASYYNQSAYPTMTQNSTTTATFRFKNVGNLPWYDTQTSAAAGVKPVVLAATGPINRNSLFNATFTRSNRPATVFNKVYESDGTTLASNQHSVQIGQIAEFSFILTAPAKLPAGTYKEMFQPIVEGGQPWDMKQVAWTNIRVTDAANVAKFYDQSNFPTIAKGNTGAFSFRFKNAGNTTWYDSTSAPTGLSPVHLAATDPINRISAFGDMFDSPNRPNVNFTTVYESDGTTLASNQHAVAPGQIAKYTFTLHVPSTQAGGTYKEMFQPILEGGNPWDMKQVAWLYLTVN